MIDTDKYEGHTEGRWLVYDRAGGVKTIANKLNDVDWELIADAPLLLAEVKQFHNFDEYITMLRNGQIDADDVCDVWDEIRLVHGRGEEE